jgi:phosphomethylpyrimidine synthase
MKITQDVRKFAEENQLVEESALTEGLKLKSEEFKKAGSELYL